ncbi:hypothetical protein AN217_19615 [Streptomyces qinglanensis]|uniref:Uncharacterized protein n=1 Tax=Streptomyces qinglanensis TaxID=943816 RepID=A0A1E7K6W3_9ACTN|nr:hypothetical protein [Streptomyces qinglanensis]OEU99651.1 hypothetical protein AN217_19615 [Streptomyces qinglanensis]OEV25267.1 hypothetical protein AN220_14670 [Streptomyces nanshensis]
MHKPKAPEKDLNTTPKWAARIRRLRRLVRRARSALIRHMLRGAASALGSTLMAWLTWWATHR